MSRVYSDRIYLDNAATSWPKPERVYAAVDQCQRHVGAPAGRGGYRHAQQADRIVGQTRAAVARMIGAADASQVAFAANGTDALNMAIHGLVRPGDHVVTTVTEHNSVLRPLRYLQDAADVKVVYVSCNQFGQVDPSDIQAALEANTRLVAINHGSNVTGAIQRVTEIGQIVRSHGAMLLIDAAQTLGHVPIDVQASGIDLLATPGHKSLLGPLGTGVLYVGPAALPELRPVRQGGTGTQSEDEFQPQAMPTRLEAGNHNVPAIAGLGTGIEFLSERSVESIANHTYELTQRLLAGLSTFTGITVHGPPISELRLPVVSLTVDGYDPQDVVTMLDASFGIQCRAGLHCAAKMHAALGTARSGGTVRLSPGFANTEAEIDTVIAALKSLCIPMIGNTPDGTNIQ